MEINKVIIIPNDDKNLDKLYKKISNDDSITIISDWNDNAILFETNYSYINKLLLLSVKYNVKIIYKYNILDEELYGIFVFENGDYTVEEFDEEELRVELNYIEMENSLENDTEDFSIKNGTKIIEKNIHTESIDSRTIESIKEILIARGYSKINDTIINSINLLEISGKNMDGLLLYCIWKIDKGKLNVKQIGEIIANIHNKNIKNCMIIHIDNISSKIMEIVDNLKILEEIDIEFYNYEDLKINPTKHILVPKHEVVSIKEATEIKRKHGKYLPLLLIKDPISRYYGFKKGDVVKITRKNSMVIYRLVV